MSYLNLHLEAERAKQRLSQAFEQPEGQLPVAYENIIDRSEESTERRWLSPESERPSKHSSRRKGSSPREAGSAGKDMSTSSFVLTVLLSGTVAAANTDQPLFWLSIGPAPLAVALAMIVLVRSRFDLLGCLRGLSLNNDTFGSHVRRWTRAFE